MAYAKVLTIDVQLKQLRIGDHVVAIQANTSTKTLCNELLNINLYADT